MKISSKLIMLVLGTFLLFSGSVALYYATLHPLDLIGAEQTRLDKVSSAAYALQTQLNLMLIDGLEHRRPLLLHAEEDFQKAQDQLKGVTYLPKLNLNILSALNVINQLFVLAKSNEDTLQEALDDLMTGTKNGAPSGEVVTFLKLYRPETGKLPSSDVEDRLQTFVSAVFNMNDMLDNIQGNLVSQGALIGSEVDKIRTASLDRMFLYLVGIFFSILVMSVLISRSISRSIKSIEKTILLVSSRDLTVRLRSKSKDEVGKLSRNFDDFLVTLHSSIRSIQQAASKNVSLKQQLTGSVERVGRSSHEIADSTESIQGRMNLLDEKAEGSMSAALTGVSLFTTFQKKLGTQVDHVKSSVDEVMELLKSLKGVATLASKGRTNVESLVEESRLGKDVIDDSFDRMGGIIDSVGQIQEMAAVIAEIASKTNILSLNAAIEAAHAGDFGKGFGVVADEIGTLAKASASSSEEIAQLIKKIMDKIAEASATRSRTNQTFLKINDRVREVADSISSIYTDVEEMQLGSQRILSSMEVLSTSSAEILADSESVDQSYRMLSETVGDVRSVSRDVAASIAEIARGLQDIASSVEVVVRLAQDIGQVGSDLSDSVNHFKTEAESKDVA